MAALAAFPLHSQRTRKLVRRISPSHSSFAFAVQLSLTPNCTPSIRPSLSERTRDRFIMLSCDNIFFAAENLINEMIIYFWPRGLILQVYTMIVYTRKIRKQNRPLFDNSLFLIYKKRQTFFFLLHLFPKVVAFIAFVESLCSDFV